MKNDSRNFDPEENPGPGGPRRRVVASEANIPDKAPDCLRCRHFKVTWEPAFPRACLLFGLKCRALPSTEVFLSTGKHCFAFQLKEGLAENSLSDSKDDE